MEEMTIHPDDELSSHADEADGGERRAAVAAHLAGCPRCARRVAELRAVRRLLAAAPAPRPARSLVPRLAAAPVWLRPVRSLASVGAGAFLFLFLASAVLQSGSNLGGGTTAAERAAARGQLSAPRMDRAAAATAAAAAAPGQSAAPAAGQSAAPAAVQSAAPAGASGAAAFGVESRAAEREAAVRRDVGPPPWVFAGLAALCAATALAVHRRLRRA